ncbi:MAG: hypothetical protein LBP87_10445, partial [Planctomycetaceae bacterium]|nr:hypothetical protein [Planctomycetaceae bacterium]
MQFITILKKECRQHFPLTVAMLLLCFLLQLSSFTLTLFGIATTPPVVIALFATVLYAGSATSVSFSIEHEEKTFGFLRNLPVSPLAIILGKVLWVILGTIFFLAGSQVLGFFFWTLMNSFSGNSDWQIFLCIYIIEIIVWGFFWSTLCRKQIHAVIATFASNTLMLYGYIYIIDFIYKVQTDPIFNTKFILIRLIMTIVVGIAAVYLMLQWFKETIRQKITSNFPQCEKVTFYHLYLPTTPFMTLLYQSVWQSLILLLVGVVVTVVACLSIVAIIFSADNIYTVILWFGLLFFVLLSGACTFGADQRNQSFRFLSRCGISARKIWWSRVLPFAIVFLPIMVTAIIIEFVCFSQKVKYGILNFNDFIFIISLTISLWMIPFSVGTFCSIYCRSMIVSVALTIPVSLIFLLWMVLGWFLCRFNPLWTTLPLTVTVLIASRLRVTDWLRELQTWKSLLKPLIPFFITVIIILLAIPFVRIYSVPYVSLDEVKNMLDKIPLADRLNPEERQKLFQETSAKLTQKITENEIEQINDWEKRMFHNNNFIYYKVSRNTNERMKRYLKNQCSELKETIKSIPIFETWILYDYEIKTRIINGGLEYNLLYSDGNMEKNIITRCRYLPWEKARILRRFNQELRSQLYRSCT